jgi:hypothetical protein
LFGIAVSLRWWPVCVDALRHQKHEDFGPREKSIPKSELPVHIFLGTPLEIWKKKR